MDYYCPECKGESTDEQPQSVVAVDKPPEAKPSDSSVLPEKISVICNGMEGIYYPKLHLVECKCDGSCGTRKQSLGEWEHHTGCRATKWKVSIKVKGSTLTLEKMLSNVIKAASALPLKEKQLFSILQGLHIWV